MTSGYTFAQEHTTVYQWKINNISSRMNFDVPNSFSISSVFSTGAKIGDKWCINLFFNNQRTITRSKNYLSIFISNVSSRTVKGRVSFYVINSKREKVMIVNSSLKEFKVNFPSWGSEKFIKKAKLFENPSDLVPNDILTICTEVTVIEDKATVPIPCLFNFSKSNMTDDYRELYNTKDYSDITIVIGDKKIQAHRIILMARSPVLAAMFNHNMIEKKTNQVSLTDITPETFEKVLRYIYTDEVLNLDDDAADLLVVADKYQLLSLKTMCEESLCRTLNCENAFKVLVLADRHSAKNLEKYVKKCISADASNIMKTEDFKEYYKSNPSLELGLFKELVENNHGAKVSYFTWES